MAGAIERTAGPAPSAAGGRMPEEPSSRWPHATRAKAGAPNVLFVVLDDTGYGHLGCYGSPIATPNIDALAKDGLLYTNMHTAAPGAPSRWCMLTGRNHRSTHRGGFAGGCIPFENGLLSEILRDEGYNTYCVGKWDLAPEDTITAAGPYDQWPLGRGFERYFGFLGRQTHQYYPELVRDNSHVQPETGPGEGYHLTTDLVDKAKAMIAGARQVAPDKPFFLYFAPGAVHAPHHAPKEWADRYAGAFDAGWEAFRAQVFERQRQLGIVPPHAELSRRDPDVQDWRSLSNEERRLYARMMEVFAGFLEHTDHCVGELLRFLKDLGEHENTLTMVISDSGSSAEGGPAGSIHECLVANNVPETIADRLKHLDDIGGTTAFNHVPLGWAHAGNTPFRRWKGEACRGGSSVPFIVCWPRGIAARGGVRPQYAHVIDMVPTVLDALRLGPPAEIRGVIQTPIEGISFGHTFDNGQAASRHVTQYFEAMGHRSLYHDGWRAVCPCSGTPFAGSAGALERPNAADVLAALDEQGWELYHVAEDVTETRNLAAQEPERLAAMIRMWYAEAGSYQVVPIESRGTQGEAVDRPRSRYVLYADTPRVPPVAAPRILNRPYSIAAEVELGKDTEGVLLSIGGSDGGISLFVRDHRLCFAHNYVSLDVFHVKSATSVPAGRHLLSMEFRPTGKPDFVRGRGSPGVVTLFVDGTEVGRGELPVTTPVRLGQGGAMLVGADAGAPVTFDYAAPFRFSGRIWRVVVDVSGERIESSETRTAMALAAR